MYSNYSFENTCVQELLNVRYAKSITTPKQPIMKIEEIPKPPSLNPLRLGGKIDK